MNRFGARRCLASSLLIVGLLLLCGGCTLFSNPFRDELAGEPRASTSSADRIKAVSVQAEARKRAFEPASIGSAEGTVTHGPLYFEDGFEDQGGDDGKFAWKSEDYVQLVYWRGRFLWNAVVFPVHVILAPPWRAMESDGIPSRSICFWRHDAILADDHGKTSPFEVSPIAITNAHDNR